MIAGTETTERNGATRVVPGSHLWGQRGATQDQAASACMKPGSCLFWLGSTFHGAGKNATSKGDPDEVRQTYGIFASQDVYRTEENFTMGIPFETVKTLSPEVLRRSGYATASTGAGFFEGADPYKYYPLVQPNSLTRQK